METVENTDVRKSTRSSTRESIRSVRQSIDAKAEPLKTPATHSDDVRESFRKITENLDALDNSIRKSSRPVKEQSTTLEASEPKVRQSLRQSIRDEQRESPEKRIANVRESTKAKPITDSLEPVKLETLRESQTRPDVRQSVGVSRQSLLKTAQIVEEPEIPHGQDSIRVSTKI